MAKKYIPSAVSYMNAIYKKGEIAHQYQEGIQKIMLAANKFNATTLSKVMLPESRL